MSHICAFLLIICICEGIEIFWLRNNRKKGFDIEEKIKFFRDFWGKFIFYVIATSVIGLFLGSIFFENIVGLNEINAWVGIVLGLVALVIGIISLFLSFYNVEQANETQEKTVKIIQEFKDDMVDRMNSLQKDVEHKIEETSERTRNEFLNYKNTSDASVKQETGTIMKWEEG